MNMEKLEFLHIACENVKLCNHCRKFWQIFKMLNIELSYDPAIPFPRHIPKKDENTSYKDMYPNVHGSIIHNSQKVETIQMALN